MLKKEEMITLLKNDVVPGTWLHGTGMCSTVRSKCRENDGK